MKQSEPFGSSSHGGLESKFPSTLYYTLAKKLSLVWSLDFKEYYKSLVRTYPEIDSSPLFAQSEDTLSSLESTYTKIQSLGVLVPVLKQVLEAKIRAIEHGEYTPIKKEGQVVPESEEVVLEDVSREIGFLGKIGRIKEFTERFIGMTVNYYTRAVNYAIANAETIDHHVVEKSLERKEFRDDIIRFMHPDYETAAEAQRERLDFGLKYIDFLYDFMELAKGLPKFDPSTPIHRLPDRERIHQILREVSKIHLERLKMIYSPRQTL